MGLDDRQFLRDVDGILATNHPTVTSLSSRLAVERTLSSAAPGMGWMAWLNLDLDGDDEEFRKSPDEVFVEYFGVPPAERQDCSSRCFTGHQHWYPKKDLMCLTHWYRHSRRNDEALLWMWSEGTIDFSTHHLGRALEVILYDFLWGWMILFCYPLPWCYPGEE